MKKWIIISIIAALIILPLGWYLGSPLFINKTVNESLSPESNSQNENMPQPIDNTSYKGTFTGADSFHQVEGEAKVIQSDGKKYLRLENFKSTNGPDLKVYLSKDTNAKEYIKLDNLKGNIGNQNYEIPENTNLEEYKYTLIWCERFGVLFGHAELKK